MKRVLIIGGGISGLTAGVYLAKNGYKVSIYEKNHNAGGFCTSWMRDGLIIDGCLHWLFGTHKDSGIGKIWRDIGGIRDDETVKLDSFYKVCYQDETLTLYSDFNKLERELLRVSKSDADNGEILRFMAVLRYLGMYETDSRAPAEFKAEHDRLSLDFARKTIKLLTCTIEEYAKKFETPILRYAFENTLVDKHFCTIFLAETISNMCVRNADLPLGGSARLINNVVEKFISVGGTLHTAAPVKEIIIENGRASGIVLEGGEIVRGDTVIAACDVHHTFERLLGGKIPYDEYKTCDEDKARYPTYSFIVLSFKTKADVSKREITEVYKVESFELLGKTYDALYVRQYAYDEALKRGDQTVLQVFIPTYEDDYDKLKSMSAGEYKEFKCLAAKKIKTLLEKYYLGGETVTLIDALTPLTYERYLNSYKGSFMSYPLGVKMPQRLHESRVDGVKGLYLSNQWLMLPGGTPVAVISGKFAAQTIIADNGCDPYAI